MADDKTIKPEYGLQTEFCKDRERLLSVVDQLAAQGKQMTISGDNFGWQVSYTRGPDHS